MSGVHFHLIVNHLPVAGAIFAILALAWAMWRKNEDTAAFAMICLVLLSIFAGMAYFSGEPAEDAVEDIATVSSPHIEQHEDRAWIASLAAGAAGVIGILGLVLRSEHSRKWLIPAGLMAALVTFGLMAWTANLGGMVRHTEIRVDVASRATHGSGQHKVDDD